MSYYSFIRRLFHPSLQRQTLAIMGFFQPNGPVMPIVEMQARWAVKVFLGNIFTH